MDHASQDDVDAESGDLEEFSLLGCGNETGAKYVMTVKFSAELYEQILEDGDKALAISFGEGENKLFVDGKAFVFRTQEDKPDECYLQKESSFEGIGLIKRKLFFNQELRKEDRERIKTISEEAENSRKGHRTVILDGNTGQAKKKPKTTLALMRPKTKSNVIQFPSSVKPKPSVAAPVKSVVPARPPPVEQPIVTAPVKPKAPPVPPPVVSRPKPPPPTVSSSPAAPPPTPMLHLKGPELRTYLIHVLAIKPAYMSKLEQRFSTKELTPLLSRVGVFKSPGVWHLKEEFLSEVRVDSWPDYSPEEREQVRVKLRSLPPPPEVSPPAVPTNSPPSVNPTTPPPPTSTQPSASTQKRKASSPVPQFEEPLPKKRINTKSPVNPPSKTQSSPINQQPTPISTPHQKMPATQAVKGGPVHTPASTNSTPTPEPTTHTITTPQELHNSRKLYSQKYEIYQAISSKLAENRKLFGQLGDDYKNEKTPAAKKEISLRIESLYNERQQEVDSMQAQYSVLHQELLVMKEAVKDYLARVRKSAAKKQCIAI